MQYNCIVLLVYMWCVWAIAIAHMHRRHTTMASTGAKGMYRRLRTPRLVLVSKLNFHLVYSIGTAVMARASSTKVRCHRPAVYSQHCCSAWHLLLGPGGILFKAGRAIDLSEPDTVARAAKGNSVNCVSHAGVILQCGPNWFKR